MKGRSGLFLMPTRRGRRRSLSHDTSTTNTRSMRWRWRNRLGSRSRAIQGGRTIRIAATATAKEITAGQVIIIIEATDTDIPVTGIEVDGAMAIKRFNTRFVVPIVLARIPSFKMRIDHGELSNVVDASRPPLCLRYTEIERPSDQPYHILRRVLPRMGAVLGGCSSVRYPGSVHSS